MVLHLVSSRKWLYIRKLSFNQVWILGDQIDGLVQEGRNSIANALELRLFCTNLSRYGFWDSDLANIEIQRINDSIMKLGRKMSRL